MKTSFVVFPSPLQSIYQQLIDNIQSHINILSAKIEQLNKQHDQKVPSSGQSPQKGKGSNQSMSNNTLMDGSPLSRPSMSSGAVICMLLNCHYYQ